MNINKLRAELSARRDSWPIRVAAEAARKFVRACDNVANFDLSVNGEIDALRRVTSVMPGAILDVGANEGQFVRAALDVVGQSRHIHSFEIVPSTFDRLCREFSNEPNVTLNGIGLGAAEGDIDLFHCADNPLMSSAYHLADALTRTIIRGRVIPGDAYLEEHNVVEVAYVKIDVEGMEMDVLRGLDRALRSNIIHAVQFEHGPSHVLARHFLRDFVELFAQRGYLLYRCFPRRLELVDYDPAFDENFTGQNFLALSTRARDACGL